MIIMSQLPQNIIAMKIGPHSNMSLNEIIKSKREEELLHKMHFWGYSGVFCQPKPTIEFCEACVKSTGVAPSLVLIETKSAYKSNIGEIRHYSINGVDYNEFKKPVQLQGAKFSFVAQKLRNIEKFSLSRYNVVGGKNEGKPLLSHLRCRINKSFATLTEYSFGDQVIQQQLLTVLIADLVEPFAIWLKD